MTIGLSSTERNHQLRTNVLRALDSDQDRPIPVDRFLPLDQHVEVLNPNRRLVIGDRGTGKTAIFHFFNEIRRRNLNIAEVYQTDRPIPSQVWLPGHDQSADSPIPDLLAPLNNDPTGARLWWLGRIIVQTGRYLREHPYPAGLDNIAELDPADIQGLIQMVRQNSGLVVPWLHTADQMFERKNLHLCLAYDFLDRLSPDGSLDSSAKLVAPLVALWMDLAPRLRKIGCKIMLRPDLFERAKRHAADTTKWQGVAVDLDWTAPDLLRVLVRHLAAEEELRKWLWEEPGRIELRQVPHLGWMPPQVLRESSGPFQLPLFSQTADWSPNRPEGENNSQRALGAKLAGQYMGEGEATRAYTHRWIISQIMDGRRRARPRSILALVREATKECMMKGGDEPPPDQLLNPSDLVSAVAAVGEARLNELREFAPYSVAVLEKAFAGAIVPISEPELLQRIDSDDCPGKIADLQYLGMIMPWAGRDPNGARLWDLPELFRNYLKANRRGATPKREAGRPIKLG